MFKLPNHPSPEATVSELADYTEILSWEWGTASHREVAAYLGRIDENRNNEGCDDDSDDIADELDDVMNEIDRRGLACGSGYPFQLDLNGTVVRHDNTNTSTRAFLYRYLLLSTRANMKQAVYSGIDGTLLFEEVCAHVMRNYIGPNRGKSLVFGTACKGSFKDKIAKLCDELHEGEGFRDLDSATLRKRDACLDVVAWVPFSDQLSAAVKKCSGWRCKSAAPVGIIVYLWM